MCVLSAPLYATELTITINGSAIYGTRSLSDIVRDMPFTLTFQTSLEGLTTLYSDSSQTQFTTQGSGQGGVTLEVGQRTFTAPDFYLVIINDSFGTNDGFQLFNYSPFQSEGLYFGEGGLSFYANSYDLAAFATNSLADFINASSFTSFLTDNSLYLDAYSNPSLTGLASNMAGGALTSITVSTAAVPEPSAFAAIAGAGVLTLAAARRRRRNG